MTDHISQIRPSQSSQRSLLSVRKVALMASVVTGLAVYGFSPLSGGFGILGSAAHAQGNRAASAVAQPYGFADMVERPKPSVISVKATMKEKASDASDNTHEAASDSPMDRL